MAAGSSSASCRPASRGGAGLVGLLLVGLLFVGLVLVGLVLVGLVLVGLVLVGLVLVGLVPVVVAGRRRALGVLRRPRRRRPRRPSSSSPSSSSPSSSSPSSSSPSSDPRIGLVIDVVVDDVLVIDVVLSDVDGGAGAAQRAAPGRPADGRSRVDVILVVGVGEVRRAREGPRAADLVRADRRIEAGEPDRELARGLVRRVDRPPVDHRDVDGAAVEVVRDRAARGQLRVIRAHARDDEVVLAAELAEGGDDRVRRCGPTGGRRCRPRRT